MRVVRSALVEPLVWIAENAGENGYVVVAKVSSDESGAGFNAETGEYGDLVAEGVIDPVKVTRSALQNAASIAGMLLTTEALVVDKPEEPEPGGRSRAQPRPWPQPPTTARAPVDHVHHGGERDQRDKHPYGDGVTAELPLVERMRPFVTTIFAEMSALAVRTGAINLGQGFPDTDGPASLLADAVAAIRAGANQYPPGPGVPELRRAIAGIETLLRAGRRSRYRGARHGWRDRGDRRDDPGPHRTGRRSRHLRAVLRLLCRVDRAVRGDPTHRRTAPARLLL